MDLNLFDEIDFDKAEDLFDSFLNSCDVVKHKYVDIVSNRKYLP